MTKSRTPQQNFPHVTLPLIVTGFGIGWLAGLAVSPVVSIVITSVIGSVATIIAALSGVKEEFLDPKTSPATVRRLLRAITAVPLAWLLIGLILGTGSGVWTRTHNWLSPAPPPAQPTLALTDEIQQWVDLGLPQEDVVRGYFESKVVSPPSVAAAPPNQTPPNQMSTVRDSVLFATASPDECTAWQTLIAKERYADLRTEVLTSAVVPFRALPIIVTDTVQLAAIVEEVLCAEWQPQ